MTGFAKIVATASLAIALVGGGTGALIAVSATPADASSSGGSNSDNSNSSGSSSRNNNSGNNSSTRSGPRTNDPRDNKGVSGLDLGSGRVKDK